MVFLFKKEDKTLQKNHWHISLLNHVNKLFSRVVQQIVLPSRTSRLQRCVQDSRPNLTLSICSWYRCIGKPAVSSEWIAMLKVFQEYVYLGQLIQWGRNNFERGIDMKICLNWRDMYSCLGTVFTLPAYNGSGGLVHKSKPHSDLCNEHLFFNWRSCAERGGFEKSCPTAQLIAPFCSFVSNYSSTIERYASNSINIIQQKTKVKKQKTLEQTSLRVQIPRM